MKKYLLTFFIIFINLNINAEIFTTMTLNVENLFDTYDDLNKDDKAFLPISKKLSEEHKNSCKKIRVKTWKDECLYLDWNEKVKDAKLKNISDLIVAYKNNGPDIIFLQEIENNNILDQLFSLLKPYGYIDKVLLEGNDYRGIDNAFISKFPIKDSRLHFIKFDGKFSNKDTRPILEASININGSIVRFYGVHFPAPFLNFAMRDSAFVALNQLLMKHNDPSIAAGDFNVTREEAFKENTFYDQEKYWDIAHHIGCNECLGTYYYAPNNDWSFLDTILVSKKRNIYFISNKIGLHKTPINMDPENSKPLGFNALSLKGVTDHIPMIAEIELRNN